METKTYILVLAGDGVNLGALGQYLNDSEYISGFWNYLPFVFCIKSSLSASDLTKKLNPFFNSTFFMVSEINKYNMNGWMPQAAWDWFHLPPMPKGATIPSASGLLNFKPPP